MRRAAFIIACLMLSLGLHAQEKTVILHHQGNVIYETPVNSIGGINFIANPSASAVFSNANGDALNTIPVSSIDSITFGTYDIPEGDMVIIAFNGNDADIINPFANDGVVVEKSQGNVTIYSTKYGVPYLVMGSSSNGSLTVNSNSALTMTLHNLSLTSATTAAIDFATNNEVTLILSGTSTLTDGVNSSVKAALHATGNLVINEDTSSDISNILRINGLSKHGILADGNLTVNSGIINILDTDSDGIHGNSALVWNGGTLLISAAGSDGLDISGNIDILSGDLSINTNAEDSRCIKVSGIFTMNDGSLTLNHTGDMSKGIKGDSLMIINGGTIDITSAGNTVLEVVDGANVPSYCSAIKCDTDIEINGGVFDIDLPTSNHGGKAISADGDIRISGGEFSIETHGDGAVYTISGNTKDAYTSSCLKCDGDMSITGGIFTLTSTGTGGKGINVGSDDHAGTLTIGNPGGSDDDLTLHVTTSGERITITAGGGGWWGGGGDYANPKAIKSMGNMTINSGTLIVNCTQTGNEGGECIESKASLTINGGYIEAYSVKDDAVNASNNITFNGGTYYAHSDNNDGTDSNGTFVINGGLLISNGARQPEEGFDCDNNQFKITGGTVIGTGGGTSTPTSSVCTQPSLKINTQSGYAIQILKSNGTVICTYKCPTLSGGGGPGGGPGGGSGLTMLFTDPQLQNGQTYTIKYNGTISGGTNWNGYYTGNVTYSGGTTVNVTVNSMYNNVNAGGNGW